MNPTAKNEHTTNVDILKLIEQLAKISSGMKELAADITTDAKKMSEIFLISEKRVQSVVLAECEPLDEIMNKVKDTQVDVENVKASLKQHGYWNEKKTRDSATMTQQIGLQQITVASSTQIEKRSANINATAPARKASPGRTTSPKSPISLKSRSTSPRTPTQGPQVSQTRSSTPTSTSKSTSPSVNKTPRSKSVVNIRVRPLTPKNEATEKSSTAVSSPVIFALQASEESKMRLEAIRRVKNKLANANVALEKISPNKDKSNHFVYQGKPLPRGEVLAVLKSHLSNYLDAERKLTSVVASTL